MTYYIRRKNYIYFYSVDPGKLEGKPLKILIRADFAVLMLVNNNTVKFEIIKNRYGPEIQEKYKDILLMEALNLVSGRIK